MAESDYAIASVSLDASGGTDPDVTVSPSDFTDVQGSALSSGDAVVVRTVIHENSLTLNRLGDPNTDGTFEISQKIQSRTGAGERTSDALIVTQYATLEAVNDAGSAQEVTFIGQVVPSSQVFVEQAAAVADTNALTRTTASRGTNEQVFELVTTGNANLVRRYDANDDGTYEMSAEVAQLSQGVHNDKWLGAVDASGRTNAAMQTELVNDSGSAQDLMILGTIGGI